MVNRRDFVSGLFGLIGAGAVVHNASGEDKTCPPKTATEIGLDRQGGNWSNDPLDRFTLVTRERITEEFAKYGNPVPVHSIIGVGKTSGIAQVHAFKEIRKLCIDYLAVHDKLNYTEKPLLYIDEFPVSFGRDYVEVGYFVAVKALS